MEVELELLNQDVDIMSRDQQATIQSSPPLIAKQALSEEEEIVPLDDGSVIDTYSITYDELKKNIV